MTSPAFQFYPDDFLAGVADMTQAEVGAYILLLCQQWNRGAIPSDPERMKLLAKGKISSHVLAKFVLGEDGQMRNQRLEKCRKTLTEFKLSKSLAGKKGMEKRWKEAGGCDLGHNTVIAELSNSDNTAIVLPITKDNSPVSSLQSPFSILHSPILKPLTPSAEGGAKTDMPKKTDMPNPFDQTAHEDALRYQTAAGETFSITRVLREANATLQAQETAAVPTPEAPAPAPKAKGKGPLQLRAEKLMGRRPETPLTAGEHRAFTKNKPAIEATTEEDWLLLEAFYAAPQIETFSRKDLGALINNWNGEVDRAKAWKATPANAGSRAEKHAELGRATRELATLGKLSDHNEGSKPYRRIEALRAAIVALRTELGVIA